MIMPRGQQLLLPANPTFMLFTLVMALLRMGNLGTTLRIMILFFSCSKNAKFPRCFQQVAAQGSTNPVDLSGRLVLPKKTVLPSLKRMLGWFLGACLGVHSE